jgi:hypothetical protein
MTADSHACSIADHWQFYVPGVHLRLSAEGLLCGFGDYVYDNFDQNIAHDRAKLAKKFFEATGGQRLPCRVTGQIIESCFEYLSSSKLNWSRLSAYSFAALRAISVQGKGYRKPRNILALDTAALPRMERSPHRQLASRTFDTR